ncbi:MAG: hypothetical protein ABIT96_11645 [Ferruginibacter sp.]
MKTFFIAMVAVFAFGAAGAQTVRTTSTSKVKPATTVQKTTQVTTPSHTIAVAKTTPAKATGNKERVRTTVITKGTASAPGLKADGTADMRYKKNKETATHNGSIHLTKSGNIDRRYKRKVVKKAA